MLDFGFSEILLIFVLALVVLGPEKLPRVASQVGRWIGRARGMARQFREQLEEEINLEDARKAQQAARSAQPVPPETQVPAAAGAAPADSPTPADSPAATSDTPPPQGPAPQGAIPKAAEPQAPFMSPIISRATGEATPSVTGDAATQSAAGEPRSATPPLPPEQPQQVYPDHYSHAHPTDELGRDISAAQPPQSTETPHDSGQHDWIGGGGVTNAEKPASNATDAAYAPPHGRGT